MITLVLSTVYEQRDHLEKQYGWHHGSCRAPVSYDSFHCNFFNSRTNHCSISSPNPAVAVSVTATCFRQFSALKSREGY